MSCLRLFLFSIAFNWSLWIQLYTGIFFFYICILHIFLHSFSAFVCHFCISHFLHFRFCSFPLYSAFVILFCFSIFLCQHSSFLILLIRISFLFPFSFLLFRNLYIFDRHGCIYLYTWINVYFQKFDSFFCFLFLGYQLFQLIFASPCRLFSHFSAVCRQSAVSPSSVL